MQSCILHPVLVLLALAASARCNAASFRELSRGDAAENLDQASLREMFQEVEELMEDTQLKLQGAAREMELKQGRMLRDLERVSDNYNKSSTRSAARNPTIRSQQEVRKNCTRDGECYSDHLCIWGQCRAGAVKGQTGSICEQQRDCRANLCCAFYTYLLFPVCIPLSTKGRPCHDPRHRLLDLITWEMEPEGALEHCPCSKGLMCQPKGKALLSVCKDPEMGTVTTDPPQYVEMEEMLLPPVVALEGPGNGESYTDMKPDMEEVRPAVNGLLDKRNAEQYEHDTV
ncbi:dickkopf-related protein 3b isoform X2 [Scyliorhinus canicula]|uniref:dickkopf-related protein 3b isoform X2 n=1 Tax=Scyliorhinus canicula TaxID=7830 RepID=UPI0018F795F3|nr:dickkopf-related protein 3b isoform X2 [Scyliorhinus canicula]